MAFDIPVPDGEWEKPTLLGFEREMLGLYVSDHPLLGIEHALAAETDCSVAQLLSANDEPERSSRGDRADGQIVTLGGILSGVTRKVTRQGASWAAATLEDLEGAIEVLFFPATYQTCMHLVVEDAIVIVKGRLDRREEVPKLVAMEVKPADLPADSPALSWCRSLSRAACRPSSTGSGRSCAPTRGRRRCTCGCRAATGPRCCGSTTSCGCGRRRRWSLT